jgi:hypothetical protein
MDAELLLYKLRTERTALRAKLVELDKRIVQVQSNLEHEEELAKRQTPTKEANRV